MRRLTVVQLLPALHSGGVERSTLEIAAALVAAGHRSIVISEGGRLVDALVAGGSEHIALPLGRKSPAILPAAFALRRRLAALAPDIVHARSRLPAWLARFALRGLPAPRPRLVTTVHGLNSPGRYSGVMCRGDAVVCVSTTVHDYVRRHWPGTDPARLRVIPRGVDPADFPRGFEPDPAWRAAWAARHPALQGGRVLLMPGRGTRLKGHAEAIELLATLRGQGLDLRLWLPGADAPGRGAYLDELRALAAARGVADAVVASPPRDDMREAYAVSDLVLQLSAKPEAFGRTVVEALSIGRPVLGWDHGGVGELLRALCPAGAVPLGDRAALAQAARALLAAPPPMPVTIPHTLAAMQSATLELYDQLVAD
ncbi:MAG TPA: glycosyltransferase [Arenimonas sp.]|uniref:glycosyltransferase n=1 Tax=Arenimonas sp. TaxID=1872635 RepID=UPI002D7F38AB|nr:glycosyltransferase [Arenimonas sp.]HEU0152913.1 glycosyltransferase [Arenimonas sp.]